MPVLLDSNILFSALLKADSQPARIVDQWLDGRFTLLTCQQQINEIRHASRHPKFRNRFLPHHVGAMINNMYDALLWPEPIPRRYQAADPTDSFLLDLIAAAQPDYAVTGDRRAGLLEHSPLGRTCILGATRFSTTVLHLD